MSTRLFKRPEIDKTELEKELEKSIFEKTAKLEKLYEIYQNRNEALEKNHIALKSEKDKEMSDLENILSFKRQEHEQLLKPIIGREQAVQSKESELNGREIAISSKEEQS